MQKALYRKYRPANFEELLGQELVVRALKEAAKQEKIAHAYLLAGPRGTGKTTTARLIAKIANCETRHTDASFLMRGEPCNRCSSCTAIDEGRNLDVIEIDAASNRGIDEIRDLKENVRVAPASSRFKVFIIDEAHQLTKEATNALLKTIEEPPPYIIIVLATTEPEKIPATIVSRTQQFYFKHIPLETITKKLERIAKDEHIRISHEALDLIASSSEGSFRDAESLLDQLISFGGGTISLDDVERMVGKVGFDTLSEFADALLRSDLDTALSFLHRIYDSGFHIPQFTKDAIHYLRRVAVLKFNPESRTSFEHELMKAHLEKLTAHAQLFKTTHLSLLKSLIAAYGQMRYSPFPLIPLELTLIEHLSAKA